MPQEVGRVNISNLKQTTGCLSGRKTIDDLLIDWSVWLCELEEMRGRSPDAIFLNPGSFDGGSPGKGMSSVEIAVIREQEHYREFPQCAKIHRLIGQMPEVRRRVLGLRYTTDPGKTTGPAAIAGLLGIGVRMTERHLERAVGWLEAQMGM